LLFLFVQGRFVVSASSRQSPVQSLRFNVFMSAEGCAQGDTLGPFLFAIGYHWTLLEMQVSI